MLSIIRKHKSEIIDTEPGLYRLFCVATVAFEVVAVSLVTFIIIGATFFA